MLIEKLIGFEGGYDQLPASNRVESLDMPRFIPEKKKK